jgi:type IV secretion system protein VirB8
MKPQPPETKETYFSQADNWAQDRQQAQRASQRIAWIVASVAVVIAVLEAIALSVLTPLKTVVPYTLMVDRQTGYVQALNPLEPNRIAPDAALTQSFLVQYVIAREGFDFATVQNDYRKVALWSADSASSDYLTAMQVSNPDSPLVRLPRSAVVETRVRSVSALGARSSLVRFETIRRDRGGAQLPPQGWVAIITYRYSDKPMSTEDRYLNPLGFQVLRYRRSAETPPIANNEPPQGSNTPAPTYSVQVRPSVPGALNSAERP